MSTICRHAHLVFGANTDVGKTIVTAGLIRSALLHLSGTTSSLPCCERVSYVKPLQCGGSDELFVSKVVTDDLKPSAFRSYTLFSWESFSSPHHASRIEGLPVSDDEIVQRLKNVLDDVHGIGSGVTAPEGSSSGRSITFVETAGGVLSPASTSPLNDLPRHSRGRCKLTLPSDASWRRKEWGWSTQGDVYRSLGIPTILVGDGRLGGISATLCALEALVARGYRVDALVLIADESGLDSTTEICVNAEACKEFLSSHTWRERKVSILLTDQDVFSLPPLPPHPKPLDEWYCATSHIFDDINCKLDLKRIQ